MAIRLMPLKGPERGNAVTEQAKVQEGSMPAHHPMAGHTPWLEGALNAQRDGRFAEAQAVYQRVLRQEPGHPVATHFLGVLLFQCGQTDAGLALVQSSLAAAPGLSDWHNTLGNMLAQLGRADEAVAAFMGALEVDARHALAWNNLGALLLEQGNVEGARMALQNAVAMDPAFRDALQNLGDAHTRAGDAHAAALCYCAEYVLRPPDLAQRQMLGIAYSQLGRHEEAAQVYEAWLQDEPGHPIATHLLAACRSHAAVERASDAYLQAYFDGFADTFERKLLGSLGYQVPAALGDVVRKLGVPPRSLRVLDVGCGTGLCGVELRPFARWLVGVDLSAKSLDKARGKAVYDTLHQAEIVAHLAGSEAAAYDLVVAADTLIYFGGIERLVQGVRHVLAPGGWFIASLEVLPADSPSPYAIQPSGRYSHRQDDVQQVLAAAGLEVQETIALDLRHELGRPVPGALVVSRWPGDG